VLWPYAAGALRGQCGYVTWKEEFVGKMGGTDGIVRRKIIGERETLREGKY
jgi:hypothetical protein